jgi:hypothetical protein
MGLLDDAIREHLELKRRRGADPEEVARLEDEALGDPRRGEFAQPNAPAAVPLGAVDEAPPPDPAGAEEAPPEPADPPAPEPEAAPPEPPSPRDEPWLEDEPVAPPPRTPEPAAADVGQPTAEFAPFDVEREQPDTAREPEGDVVRPDDEPAPDEDVLEETPEFLQETPEHDRLWFEQKPPRGFDFYR